MDDVCSNVFVCWVVILWYEFFSCEFFFEMKDICLVNILSEVIKGIE